MTKGAFFYHEVWFAPLNGLAKSMYRCLAICNYSHVSHPSPVSAQQACTCHPWSLIEVRFKCCDISAADKDPFTSCLLANTSTFAFLRSCVCLWVCVCVYVGVYMYVNVFLCTLCECVCVFVCLCLCFCVQYVSVCLCLCVQVRTTSTHSTCSFASIL